MIQIIPHENCCGCEACANICPKNAISMKKDIYGFYYPDIDQMECIDCKLCQKICPILNNNSRNDIIKSLCVVSKDKTQKLKSSSGGVFPLIAEYIISTGGYVAGAIFDKDSFGNIYVKHIISNKIEDIKLFQNSKYVQSRIGNIYIKTRELLVKGSKVLFTGTPCQIAALYSFLQIKYDNLYTIEVICHGVPSINMMQDYIKFLELKNKWDIKGVCFRDKAKEWSKTISVTYTKNNIQKIKILPYYKSSYFDLFLKGDLLRESCFNCKFATNSRVADITLGDFWGIENTYPQFLKGNGGEINRKEGVSCCLINNDKGQELLGFIYKKVLIYDADFNNIAKYNKQLIEKFNKGINRSLILSSYLTDGYRKIDKLDRKLYLRKNLYNFHKSQFIKRLKSNKHTLSFLIHIKKSKLFTKHLARRKNK